MSNISISYDLGSHGWSSFRLTIGDNAIDVGPFGYCTDALGDLVRAALMLGTSDVRVEVSFDSEPREWRIIVDEGWKPELRLRILTFADASPVKWPEEKGQIIIEDRVTADGFARAVQKVGQEIWDTYGATGYNKAWIGRRGFPLRGLKALDAALSYDEPPPKG
jgi:hypothetical protein